MKKSYDENLIFRFRLSLGKMFDGRLIKEAVDFQRKLDDPQTLVRF
jgi:hypothetical protein